MIGETLRKRHAEETYAALKEKEYRQKKDKIWSTSIGDMYWRE